MALLSVVNSDRSRRLSEVEKQEVRINKGERAFELEACPLIYPDEFRETQVAKFAKQIRQIPEGAPLTFRMNIFWNQ